MDINFVRSAVTVLSLLAFVLIVVWAYAGRHKKKLAEQGMLPPDEYDIGGSPK